MSLLDLLIPHYSIQSPEMYTFEEILRVMLDRGYKCRTEISSVICRVVFTNSKGVLVSGYQHLSLSKAAWEAATRALSLEN